MIHTLGTFAALTLLFSVLFIVIVNRAFTFFKRRGLERHHALIADIRLNAEHRKAREDRESARKESADDWKYVRED